MIISRARQGRQRESFHLPAKRTAPSLTPNASGMVSGGTCKDHAWMAQLRAIGTGELNPRGKQCSTSVPHPTSGMIGHLAQSGVSVHWAHLLFILQGDIRNIIAAVRE
nr:hypothetical protein CFP56_72108 [Quercus suber]